MGNKRIRRIIALLLTGSFLVGQVQSDSFVKAAEGGVVENSGVTYTDEVDNSNEISVTPKPTDNVKSTKKLGVGSFENKYIKIENNILTFKSSDMTSDTSINSILPESERDKVKSIVLGENATNLPDNLFADMETLNEVTIKVPLVKGIFKNCSNLQVVHLEGDFDGIVPQDAFLGCDSLYKIDGTKKINKVLAHGFKNAITSRKVGNDYVTSLDFSELTSASDGAFEGAFKYIHNYSIEFNSLSKAYLNTFKNAFYGMGDSEVKFSSIENFGDSSSFKAYPDVQNDKGYNDIGGVFEGAFRYTTNVNVSFPSLVKLYDGVIDGAYKDGEKVATNNFSLFKDALRGKETSYNFSDEYSYKEDMLKCIDSSIGVKISFPILNNTSINFSSEVSNSEVVFVLQKKV